MRADENDFKSGEFPVDPDIDSDEDQRHQRNELAQTRWPRLPTPVIAAVFAGGCLGGYARYAIVTAWKAGSAQFPLSTFAVNVIGAFVLGFVIVIASRLRPTLYLRPLIGTGFCGGLTTFSSVAVAVDQLLAHGHPATAAGYLAATIMAGLAAAALGLLLGQTLLVRNRHPSPAGPV